MSADRQPDLQQLQSHPERQQHRDGTLLGLVLAWDAFRFFTSSLARIFLRRTSPPAAVKTPAANAPEKTGRAADRNLQPARAAAARQRWGMLLVISSFLIALAGGIGFLFVYWNSGDNFLLGATLALCFGGFGFALVLYSHWLIAAREAIEPREKHSSSYSEREQLAADFYAQHDFHRRSLLKWLGLGAIAMLSAMVISIMRSLGRPPGPSLFTTVWKRGQSLTTPDGAPVTVNALQPGDYMIVFPQDSIGDEKAQTVLVRVNEHALQLPAERANWAPMGYVAYSRVCTHAGCSVGMFATTTHELICPCHQSTFDVLRAAKPTGGPAARPLPQLPLYADADGTLRAGGGFSEPPGPGFWEMP